MGKKFIYRALLQNVAKIVGCQIFFTDYQIRHLVIRPDYQKFCYPAHQNGFLVRLAMSQVYANNFYVIADSYLVSYQMKVL